MTTKDEKTKTICLADVMGKLDLILQNLEDLKGGSVAVPKGKKKAEDKGNGKHKLGKDEKEALKKKLLKGVPYSKADLEGMKFQELKTLGSSLGAETFGLGRSDCVKNVLAAQKKAEKKEPDKKAGHKVAVAVGSSKKKAAAKGKKK